MERARTREQRLKVVKSVISQHVWVDVLPTWRTHGTGVYKQSNANWVSENYPPDALPWLVIAPLQTPQDSPGRGRQAGAHETPKRNELHPFSHQRAGRAGRAGKEGCSRQLREGLPPEIFIDNRARIKLYCNVCTFLDCFSSSIYSLQYVLIAISMCYCVVLHGRKEASIGSQSSPFAPRRTHVPPVVGAISVHCPLYIKLTHLWPAARRALWFSQPCCTYLPWAL